MYEGMFILPKSMTDEQMDEAVASVRQEIEKMGGEVKSAARLGKRGFARPLKKQDSGYYYVVDFEIEGSQITPLTNRFKLNEHVFRVQFVKKQSVQKAA